MAVGSKLWNSVKDGSRVGKNTVKGINEGLFETVPGFVDGSFDGSTDILKLGIEEGS